MSVILAVVGIAIIAFVFIDALWTTLWLDGSAGPLASRMTTWLWQIARRVFGDQPGLLSLAGPIFLVLTVLTWTVLLWIGWILLFSADPNSVVHSNTHVPADRIGRVYFVGYTVFTLGNGDFAPQGWWRIITILSVASGFVLITLVVSYVLSVVSAATAARALAGQITAMGDCAESFVLSEWDAQGFPTLAVHLNTIATQLGSITDQHLAYPLLHYFHTANPSKASAIAVAILDDALTILEHGVDTTIRPPQSALRPARSAVTTYLDTLISASIQPALEAPPSPELATLRNNGVPVVDDRQFDRAIRKFDDRRRRLLAIVEDGCNNWPT